VVAQGFEIAYSKAIWCPSKWDAAVILNLPHMDPHNYILILKRYFLKRCLTPQKEETLQKLPESLFNNVDKD